MQHTPSHKTGVHPSALPLFLWPSSDISYPQLEGEYSSPVRISGRGWRYDLHRRKGQFLFGGLREGEGGGGKNDVWRDEVMRWWVTRVGGWVSGNRWISGVVGMLSQCGFGLLRTGIIYQMRCELNQLDWPYSCPNPEYQNPNHQIQSPNLF